jgi:hypothetical protein
MSKHNVFLPRESPVAKTTGLFIIQDVMIMMLKIYEWFEVAIEFLIIAEIIRNGTNRKER